MKPDPTFSRGFLKAYGLARARRDYRGAWRVVLVLALLFVACVAVTGCSRQREVDPRLMPQPMLSASEVSEIRKQCEAGRNVQWKRVER